MNVKPAVLRPGLFRDRREAGRLLAAKLSAYANCPDVIVLALGGTVEYFRDTVFNYPTLAEAYRVAALDGLNKL